MPSAHALEDALRENGLRTRALPALSRRSCANWAHGTQPVTLESAAPYLPAGLLDNSLRRPTDGSYVAAIAFYPVANANHSGKSARLLARTIRTFCGVFLR